MPNKKATKKRSRIKVDKLQKEEKGLTKEEQKKVKGGFVGSGLWIHSQAPNPSDPSNK